MKRTSKSSARADWIETKATVVSCRYQFARMNTLTMGVRTGENFRIAFDYYAHGQRYTGEFQSPKAIPQSEKIPIRYNPLRPQQNSYSEAAGSSASGRMFAFGIGGSIVLSLLWLALLRGCS